jgi:hypothetical protein
MGLTADLGSGPVGVDTPDSLQVVAALAVGCTAFLTNDSDLPPLPGLRILQLSSYVR